jgi:HSP20 family protein
MQPLYTEYNVGHYARSFQISNKINQSEISALMKDGVVTIVLPKAEQAKPRKIQVRCRGGVTGQPETRGRGVS